MSKIFVLRTEAALASVDVTLRFGGDNTVVIPMAILQNLYRYQGLTEKQNMANKIIEYIDSIPKSELLSTRGYQQINGSFLRVVDNSPFDEDIESLEDFSRLDKRVYQVCKDLKRESSSKVILISKNPTIRLKAHQLGISSQPFKDEIFPKPEDQYKGFVQVYASDSVVSKFYGEALGISVKEIYHSNQIEWIENEFVLIKSETSQALGRYTKGHIVPLKYSKCLPVGFKALNIQQKFFWEALLTPPEEAPLIVVKGPAGTGKTFCSLAMAQNNLAGYSGVGMYHQIVLATPLVTVDDEHIGYLPGDINDKVSPYLKGVMDNLQEIFRLSSPEDTILALNSRAEYLFAQKFIEIQPIGFLRGRSISNTVFIIDEAQNIKPSIIKDIVTRAAVGSKFIFLGDPDQVNNPDLNSRYNGLVYLSEKMKGNAHTFQITLDKSVRSTLAQEALCIL